MKFSLTLYLFIGFRFIGFSQEMNYDSLINSRSYNQIIEQISNKEKQKTLSLDEIYRIAKAYGHTENYSNGLFYGKKMEKMSLQKKDTVHLLQAYNLIAENLIDLDKIEEGIKFCDKVAPVFRKQDSISFQKFCFKWGLFHKIQGNNKKALQIYDNITLEKYRKLDLFTNNYATILENLGRFNDALKFYKKGLQWNKDMGDDLVLPYTNIALILYKLNKEKEAKVYLDSAESAITKKTPLRSQKFIYNNLYKYYSREGDIFNAEIALDYINSINEDIFNKRLNEKIQVLENAHQTEQKLNTQLEKSQKRQFLVAIFALLIIFSLIFFLFTLKLKNVKTAHEKIVIEQKLLRSQMTPHFIFNSLSVLQGMILNNEKQKATSYLAKFSRLLRLVLENSREKLVPIHEEIEAVKNYVDLQNMRNDGHIVLEINYDNFLENHLVEVPPMIIQPFVENAILHGFNNSIKNPQISIDLSYKNKKLFCVIKDNGIGINSVKKEEKTTKDSLSTKITIERLHILSKELKVETGLTIKDRSEYKEKGTIIILIIPYKIEDND